MTSKPSFGAFATPWRCAENCSALLSRGMAIDELLAYYEE
jgi:hypothetical protein